MNEQMKKVKKIAEKLVDYNYILDVVNNQNNKQEVGGKKVALYDEATLSHGLPAVCLLFAELSYAFPKEGWDIKAHEFLKKIQQRIEMGQVYDLSMFSGYAGIGLAVDGLSKNGTRYTNFTKYINEYIKETFPILIKKLYESKYCFMRDYDVISGVSGILGYAIVQKDMEEICKEIGNYLVYRCQKIKFGNLEIPGFFIPKENQFLESDKKRFPNGNFNLGLSHGVPGILLALCMLENKKIEVSGLYEAIETCIDFLFKFIYKDAERWGAYVSLENYCDKLEGIDTRDAWCYGSPGVSYAMYMGGEILNRKKYKELSVQVMKNVIEGLQGIYSPTFCHGYAGVAYIFWRFFNLTGIKVFEEFSCHVVDKIWEFYNETNPLGFKDIEYQSMTDQVGLLSGVSGILLPILAIYGIKHTKWDYAFMLGDFTI